jgi:hypothetical protein
MEKWEYKVLRTVNPSEDDLNSLGAQGWELVSATYNDYGSHCILKRRISD